MFGDVSRTLNGLSSCPGNEGEITGGRGRAGICLALWSEMLPEAGPAPCPPPPSLLCLRDQAPAPVIRNRRRNVISGG